MKPTIVLSIAACLLMLTPAVAADDGGAMPEAAPCPDGPINMGVPDYAACMAKWGSDSVGYVLCIVTHGIPNCSPP